MNLSGLKYGDTDPNLGKKIKELILSTDTFIVYLDEDDVIQWSTSGKTGFGDQFGSIQNQISFWESISNRMFSKQESCDYKCLLAEGYARMLDDNNREAAQDIINLTKDRITIQAKEVLRQEYLMASVMATAAVVAALITSMVFKSVISNFLGKNVFDIYLTGLMGGIGAFVSATIRSKNYDPEIKTSKRIHRIDGILRIAYGIIAGVLISIGIKANIIFGFINGIDRTIFVETFLGAVAGASESILPNIIKQMEGKV